MPQSHVTAALAFKVCPACRARYDGGEVFCPVDATRLVSTSQVPVQRVTDPDDPLIGVELAGRYQVIRRVGEGGMGLVYEGRHAVIEKQVAIKVLRDDFSKRPEVVERFRQEAKSASRIGNAHIVDIHDFGETPSGASYFVMEFLKGQDLADCFDSGEPLPEERIISIALQCCKALGAAHRKGIVHRDMKPENVFLSNRDGERDFVKIVDFGIAKMSDIETEGAPGRKLTKTGMIFGTPEYMAPEQAKGSELDHRVDIYALGVILYEAVTGRVPFVGDSFMGILTQHMFEEPPPLREINPDCTCSAALESVIARAMAKDPDQRFQTMEQLAVALEGASRGVATEAVSMNTVLGGRPTVPSDVGAVGANRTLEVESKTSGRGGRLGLLVGIVVLLGVAGAGAFVALRPLEVASDAVDAGASEAPTVVEPSSEGSAPGSDPAASSAGVVTPTATEQTFVKPSTTASGSSASEASVGASEASGSSSQGSTNQMPSTATTAPRIATLTVETSRTGARASIEGGPSCDPTPCTLRARVGREITIIAEKGAAQGSVTLKPTGDGKVTIRLRSQGRVRPTDSGSSTRMGGRRGSGDLKVPDWGR